MADEKIYGYAALFSEPTVIAGAFMERIAVGAFDQSLRDFPDVRALLDHDTGRVIGRTASGTLAISTNRIGLLFEVVPDTAAPDGLTALSWVGRQDVSQCSIGFMVESETWDWPDDGELPQRTIERARLLELSIVAFPAYDGTSARIAGRSKQTDKVSESFRPIRDRQVANAQAAMRARGIIV